MAIEIKEIIVQTTVSEETKTATVDPKVFNRLKKEIIEELRREQSKRERHKKDR